MPDIVSLEELQAYLGDAPATDDDLLTALLDNVEALYERATLRDVGFYKAAAEGVTEVLDGTGSPRLYLAYPIATLTSIALGYSAEDALDVSDPAVVSYAVGSRVVARTDGDGFGKARQPRYVHVVYDHQGNVPADAKLPIMEVVASVYRGRGSEGIRSETIGDYSYSRYAQDGIHDTIAGSVLWQMSVEANRAAVIG